MKAALVPWVPATFSLWKPVTPDLSSTQVALAFLQARGKLFLEKPHPRGRGDTAPQCSTDHTHFHISYRQLFPFKTAPDIHYNQIST